MTGWAIFGIGCGIVFTMFWMVAVVERLTQIREQLRLSNRHLHEMRRIMHPYDEFPRSEFDRAE